MVIPPMGGALVATGTLLTCGLRVKYEEMRSVQNQCTMQGPQDACETSLLWRCFLFSILRTMPLWLGVMIGSRTF